MTPPEPRGGEGLKRFPDDEKDVQSRFVIVHQLRASADIQSDEITRRMGMKATTDRASLMREAADTIERLASPSSPLSGGGGWPSREEVARVLEPWGPPEPGRGPVTISRWNAALTKADAILALFPPVADEMVRDQTDGVGE